MASTRDPFANFERVRREVDELLGGARGRTALGPRSRAGFSPRVDVYYQGDPAKAVVEAELAGFDEADLQIEVRGRELLIAGRRQPPEPQDRVYQQLEIEHGTFRRVIALGADVDAEATRASYVDGLLRVELPLAPPERRAHRIPLQTDEGSTS